ncbi:MAG TPA: PEGA domain-containing protein [Myxococcota bacterium]|nr:PEGA domain-containing protein [Myxococcota bacterium]
MDDLPLALELKAQASDLDQVGDPVAGDVRAAAIAMLRDIRSQLEDDPDTAQLLLWKVDVHLAEAWCLNGEFEAGGVVLAALEPLELSLADTARLAHVLEACRVGAHEEPEAWVPGYWDGQREVLGWWRPESRSGFRWVVGFTDEQGVGHPGYWEPVADRAGERWEPGSWSGTQWIAGTWVVVADHVPVLVVQTEPMYADVYLNGVWACAAPCAVQVEPGAYDRTSSECDPNR